MTRSICLLLLLSLLASAGCEGSDDDDTVSDDDDASADDDDSTGDDDDTATDDDDDTTDDDDAAPPDPPGLTLTPVFQAPISSLAAALDSGRLLYSQESANGSRDVLHTWSAAGGDQVLDSGQATHSMYEPLRQLGQQGTDHILDGVIGWIDAGSQDSVCHMQDPDGTTTLLPGRPDSGSKYQYCTRASAGSSLAAWSYGGQFTADDGGPEGFEDVWVMDRATGGVVRMSEVDGTPETSIIMKSPVAAPGGVFFTSQANSIGSDKTLRHFDGTALTIVDLGFDLELGTLSIARGDELVLAASSQHEPGVILENGVVVAEITEDADFNRSGQTERTTYYLTVRDSINVVRKLDVDSGLTTDAWVATDWYGTGSGASWVQEGEGWTFSDLAVANGEVLILLFDVYSSQEEANYALFRVSDAGVAAQRFTVPDARSCSYLQYDGSYAVLSSCNGGLLHVYEVASE